MLNLITGQKAKFTDAAIAQQFTLVVELTTSMVTDVACFGLNTEQQLANDDYMTFYNQPKTPCGAVSWQADNQQQRFNIDLTKLPSSIDYLVLTATIDGQATMRELGASTVKLEQAGQVLASYTFDGSGFDNQRAVMLLQVYRKSDTWRINAIGQGFNGGLSALVTHFGGEVAEDDGQASTVIDSNINAGNNSLSSTTPTSTTNLASSTSNVISNSPALNLKKVTLDKPGSEHRITLTKGDNEHLVVEAIWMDNGDASADNDDLDLRVGILAHHSKDMSYIHAPAQIGSLTTMPFIQHQGDIKVASINEPGKEIVLVNPAIAKYYGGKLALVFSVYSAVSNGMVSIASLQPKMRMQYKDQVVECVFNIKASPKAKSNLVYTYVIGIAIIDEQGITLQHSGEVSKRMSEATPRLMWKKDKVELKIDGAPMFKAN
ncbi:TerD family protein [Psychrobacter sp. TAE2020]|uniref:TerD family protein n=1 Tax=Psychrobacter sp. TAE2020 TaxID=2846762 RepID=UPI001C107CD9|nr:TerD family protein [Psychrobacter sp. TAE2020]MBU5616419.1 TerD family protein [Psychrobacter sp. TAE2020]